MAATQPPSFAPASPSSPSPTSTPLTITEWRTTQTAGAGLARLLALVDTESKLTSPAWISLASPDLITQQWSALPVPTDPAADSLPLYGIPFAVKDNIDGIGFVSTAGCPEFSSTICTADAAVVARLKAAGAILVGKTNLDQFATGLNGTRSPHFGPTPNAWDPSRVSGGSSSGSAVVVSRGVVPFSLGTDTAGSGRVPAGLNNIIGLKPTRGALSTRGVLPACQTLDCVSIFALTSEDAAAVLSVAEGYDREDAYSRRRSPSSALTLKPRIAICDSPPWFGQTEQRDAYDACLAGIHERLNWKLEKVDFSPLFDLARLLYNGPWVAERYQAIRGYIEDRGAPGMDPVVRGIIMEANKYSAADAFAAEYKRQQLTRVIDEAFGEYDYLLVPTAPTFPSMQDMQRAPVEENSRLGTYTNFVNFLDWTALSIPAGFRPGFGFIGLGQPVARQPRLIGATGQTRQESLPAVPRKLVPRGAVSESSETFTGTTDVIVVGAHLSGLPLNKDLVERGATLKISTATAPSYKLYALAAKGPVKKPGLERVATGGSSIAVEVWSMPTHNLGSFLATIPHPLGLGSLELEDGSWSLGFICEPSGLQGADDITEHGGWKTYLATLTSPKTSRAAKPLSKVLTANRGEIAVRIIRTLHTLGMQAVAIYSAADAAAPHVRLADTALALGPGSVVDTYLNGTRIIELALSVNADAVIPGYGFLAENADFADAVEAAGMTWVGPTGDQMRQLGLKHVARSIAEAAHVPVVPGTSLKTTVDEARRAAVGTGYPLLLKSTAGGGGIGLKRCDNEAELVAAFEGVQRLAAANFANSGVFLEKFIAQAKHIEVQVIGDGTGRVLVAGDRDCSVQRRHQKLVEEAPAPFLSDAVRQQMYKAAVDLAASVRYRNVGTVEFIYDIQTHEFFFLEVNTRLQVEHPTTESVTGLDLVECMLHIAGGEAGKVFRQDRAVSTVPTKGASIEVRLYAESPLQQFRPSSGHILDVALPFGLDGIRVDTWIERGLDVSSAYDPLLAKIVATGATRADAIQKLTAALDPANTRIVGLETNAAYLRHVILTDWFASGDFTTHSMDLESFVYTEPALQIIDAGPATTVQDWPGRKGLWNVGVPPSGPMDQYSFRLANQAVGNAPDAPALECTLQGPKLLFYSDTTVAVTGATTTVFVGDKAADTCRPIAVRAGQTLSVGSAQSGYRIYVAVRGGIAVPSVLGSRSTFEVGKFGGHNGRKLQAGDLLRLGGFLKIDLDSEMSNTLSSCIPSIPLTSSWKVGVVPGPHGAPDFFTEDGLASLFAGQWSVHYNSNRLGVRLSGPKPQWARQTGGEAGLHPSNVHDSPYSIGSVSFTGDEAVVVTCDGPSLGGFVVFCVVADAEMWKLGQARPGDRIQFVPITAADAIAADQQMTTSISALAATEWQLPTARASAIAAPIESPIIGQMGEGSTAVTIRQAGDEAVLMEFGEDQVFDLARSFRIYAFMEAHRAAPLPHVLELTPGVRTLHVLYELGTHPAAILATLTDTARSLQIPQHVPSRKFRLPIVFNDDACIRAVRRYASTIRKDAPWLMDNVEFLRQLNGLKKGGVEAIVGGPSDRLAGSVLNNTKTGAEFLVVGLGDVFLGSPCAVPLDPRHRLFGTKYNPSRSFTPQGAVGIGGQYMCIYAGDSPGGYQLVGRTVSIWDPKKLVYGPSTGSSSVTSTTSAASTSKPWKFRLFDRISFYPVLQSELAGMDADQSSLLVQDGDNILRLHAYESWLAGISDEVAVTMAYRRDAIANAPFISEILKPAPQMGAGGSGLLEVNEHNNEHDDELETSGINSTPRHTRGQRIKASIPGRCFKVSAQVGDTVQAGQELLWIESNKMEIHISSPVSGRVVAVSVEPGQAVMAEDVLMTIV
ncbi:urea amidolyase [Ophiostoma piceae UAMH 11346]|uniref:Urea amidolyase n=1 Tax=Ophiostoma piceae (strain UAMH 11346) TaxID=1262450 RepID=S3BXP2_OPHP1|nr:urea amidolyase [Ophiostoma piceae UAMH 11346]